MKKRIIYHGGDYLIFIINDYNEVVTFGQEDSRERADTWGDNAIRAQGWLPGHVDPDDAFDRRLC
jgi:hypothetical protein